MDVRISQSSSHKGPAFVRTPVSYVVNFSDFVFSKRMDRSLEKALEGRISESFLKRITSQTIVKATRIALFLLILGAATYSSMGAITFALSLYVIHRLHLLSQKNEPKLSQKNDPKLFKEAELLFKKIKDQVHKDKAQILLAKAQAALGKMSEAISTAYTLREVFPREDKTNTLIEMAKICIQKNDEAEADHFIGFLKDDLDKVRAHAEVAKAQAASSKEAAVKRLERAKKIAKDLTNSLIPYIRPEGYLLIAEAELSLNLEGSGRETLRLATAVAKGLPIRFKIDPLGKIAQIHIKMKEIDEAYHLLTFMCEGVVDSNDFYAVARRNTTLLIEMAKICQTIGEGEKAKNYLKMAVERVKKFPDYANEFRFLKKIAKAQVHIHDTEEAKKTLIAAMAVPNTSQRASEIHVDRLCDVAAIQHQYDEEAAKETIKKALKTIDLVTDLSSKDFRYANVAKAQAKCKDYAAALSTAENGDRYFALNFIIQAQIEHGKYDLALQTAELIGPYEKEFVFYKIAEVYLKNKNYAALEEIIPQIKWEPQIAKSRLEDKEIDKALEIVGPMKNGPVKANMQLEIVRALVLKKEFERATQIARLIDSPDEQCIAYLEIVIVES